jgi:hypothetical protein
MLFDGVEKSQLVQYSSAAWEDGKSRAARTQDVVAALQ